MTLRPLIRDLVRGPLRSPLDRRGGFDPDAAAWAAAVTAAGGTYSATTLNAVSIFVRSAKAAGYWTKLNRINLFCGDQLAAALVPLKAGGGTATETNVNFVAGDYSEATGLTGNGTTKYLRTGLIPSANLSVTSAHHALYNRSSTVDGLMGASSAVGETMRLIAPSAGTAFSDFFDTATGRVSGAVGTPYGFICGSRTAANSHTVYRNGAQVATNATTGGALPTVEIYVGALNNAGTPNSPTSSPMAGYQIGSGLSAAEVAANYTHIQAFQTALNRAV